MSDFPPRPDDAEKDVVSPFPSLVESRIQRTPPPEDLESLAAEAETEPVEPAQPAPAEPEPVTPSRRDGAVKSLLRRISRRERKEHDAQDTEPKPQLTPVKRRLALPAATVEDQPEESAATTDGSAPHTAAAPSYDSGAAASGDQVVVGSAESEAVGSRDESGSVGVGDGGDDVPAAPRDESAVPGESGSVGVGDGGDGVPVAPSYDSGAAASGDQVVVGSAESEAVGSRGESGSVGVGDGGDDVPAAPRDVAPDPDSAPGENSRSSEVVVSRDGAVREPADEHGAAEVADASEIAADGEWEEPGQIQDSSTQDSASVGSQSSDAEPDTSAADTATVSRDDVVSAGDDPVLEVEGDSRSSTATGALGDSAHPHSSAPGHDTAVTVPRDSSVEASAASGSDEDQSPGIDDDTEPSPRLATVGAPAKPGVKPTSFRGPGLPTSLTSGRTVRRFTAPHVSASLKHRSKRGSFQPSSPPRPLVPVAPERTRQPPRQFWPIVALLAMPAVVVLVVVLLLV